MKHRFLVGMNLAACAAGLALLASGACAQALGTNLIVNGDASLGTTGFTTTGAFSTTTDPAISTGAFFYGGSAVSSSGSQRIDLSALGTIIDLGTTSYALSALLGGYQSQDDNARLGISFLDAVNGTLGTASIGPVLASDRGGVTGLLSRSTAGFVPIGTRSVNVLLEINRLAGTDNDGYADNLSLTLDAAPAVAGAVPEAATWAMMLSGFGMVGGAMRRRRRFALTV